MSSSCPGAKSKISAVQPICYMNSQLSWALEIIFRMETPELLSKMVLEIYLFKSSNMLLFC